MYIHIIDFSDATAVSGSFTRGRVDKETRTELGTAEKSHVSSKRWLRETCRRYCSEDVPSTTIEHVGCVLARRKIAEMGGNHILNGSDGPPDLGKWSTTEKGCQRRNHGIILSCSPQMAFSLVPRCRHLSQADLVRKRSELFVQTLESSPAIAQLIA